MFEWPQHPAYVSVHKFNNMHIIKKPTTSSRADSHPWTQLPEHSLAFLVPHLCIVAATCVLREGAANWLSLLLLWAGFVTLHLAFYGLRRGARKLLSLWGASCPALSATLVPALDFLLRAGFLTILPAVSLSFVRNQSAKTCILASHLLLSLEQQSAAESTLTSCVLPPVLLVGNLLLSASVRLENPAETVGALMGIALTGGYVLYKVRCVRENEQKLAGFLASVPVACFLASSSNTSVLPVNDRAAYMFCESGHETTRSLFESATLLRTQKPLWELVASFMKDSDAPAEKTVVDAVELSSPARSGKKQYDAHVYCVPGQGVGVILAEPKRLDKVDQVFKTGLICSLSHELFTPLNAILPLLSMMQGKYKDDEALFNIAISNAEIMCSKANDLIDFTKLEMGELKHEMKDFELSALFDELHRIFKYEAETKRNKLSFMIMSKNAVSLFADYKRIKQILIKLISNAIKYTKDGLIQVSALSKPNCLDVQFKVQDSGIGMSHEQAKCLFSPLSRKNLLLNHKPGTQRLAGLGMTVAEKLAQSLGSHLQVETEEKKGTTFSFRLENCRMVYGWITQDPCDRSPRYPRKNSMASSPRDYNKSPQRRHHKRSLSKSRDIHYLVGNDFNGTKARPSKRPWRDTHNEPEDWADVEIPEEYKEAESPRSARRITSYQTGMEPRAPSRVLVSNVDVVRQAGLKCEPLVSRHLSHKRLTTIIEGVTPVAIAIARRKNCSKSKSPAKAQKDGLNSTPKRLSSKRLTLASISNSSIKCPLINMSKLWKQTQPDDDTLAPVDINETAELEDEKAQPGGKVRHYVLVADDGAGNRFVLKEMLRRLDVVVLEAMDGEEAYETTKASFERKIPEKLELILMDLNMPNLDGVNATRKIRNLEYKMRRELELPIVAVTAFDTGTERTACMEARMQSFLTKPVSFGKIKEVVSLYCHL